MKTVGIVGGLGPETSCSFCFNINKKIKRIQPVQPHLIMDNIPMSDEQFNKLAKGDQPKEVLELLKNSIVRLNHVNSDLIVIPCNTVHVFITELREISKIPILSIIEETVNICIKSSFRTVVVLGSTTTIKSQLYQEELNKHSITVVNLSEEEQNIVTEIILKIINFESNNEDKERVLEIIKRLKERGAEAVILGCTDLFLLVKEEDSPLPIINSTEVLEEATVQKIVGET